jgi:Asp-tRNA(Asn)/Glu-tRNA(Gln) amidotransferase A subunit family amidase
VKDNIDVAGLPTTNGLGTSWLAGEDAVAVAALRTRGLIPLGKVGLHEGALGTTTDNPHHGRVHNPRRHGHTPGGSSGGSGAAVAARLTPLALGTDTMGSVRLPAAYCGVVGFKPSRGTISTDGVTPLSTTLDHVGPLARSVVDIALVMDVALSRVRLDGGATIAVAGCFEAAEVDAETAAAFALARRRLTDAGATVRTVDIAGFEPEATRRAALILIEAEASVALADIRGRAPDAFSAEFAGMLDYGATVPGAKLIRARDTVAAAGEAVARALGEVDVLICPTAPLVAFPFERPAPADQSVFLGAANVSGAPAISIPLPVEPGAMPVGLQLVAAPGRDEALLSIARAVETLLAEAG